MEIQPCCDVLKVPENNKIYGDKKVLDRIATLEMVFECVPEVRSFLLGVYI